MRTQVVNVKNEYDVFMGRPGPWGNPFRIGENGDREQVISLYKDYFFMRLEMEPDFLQKVLALKGKRLACFCFPQACHVDVIVEFLEGLQGGEDETRIGSDGGDSSLSDS